MSAPETIQYYDEHADSFAADTVSVDFSGVRDRFLDRLPEGTRILDFGCGSGRDAKAFLERGYEVDAVDGSGRLCEIASAYTGIDVRQMFFQDLDETDCYDGIWACASVLHLSREELVDVLGRMARALREGGVIYTSFKYGTFQGMRDGRCFTDMVEEAFAELLEGVPELAVEEQWITGDVRPGRDEEWLNLILKKE